MTRSGYGEDIIEAHSHICDDDGLYRRLKCRGIRTPSMFIMVLTRTYLTIKFPYYVEEEYRAQELEPRYREEKYDSERKNNTQYRRTCYSPEYGFFPQFWREIFGRHTDEDSIISAHDEVDEDDIQECECTCRGENMEKVRFECEEKIEHSVYIKIGSL